MMKEKSSFWSFARLRVYIYRHNQKTIVSGAVRSKVNHNFLSCQSNYAPVNYVKWKPILIQVHLFWNWSLLSFAGYWKFAKSRRAVSSRGACRLNKTFCYLHPHWPGTSNSRWIFRFWQFIIVPWAPPRRIMTMDTSESTMWKND
jgi:hypothetical protein